jgi:hypothetical protein
MILLARFVLAFALLNFSSPVSWAAPIPQQQQQQQQSTPTPDAQQPTPEPFTTTPLPPSPAPSPPPPSPRLHVGELLQWAVRHPFESGAGAFVGTAVAAIVFVPIWRWSVRLRNAHVARRGAGGGGGGGGRNNNNKNSAAPPVHLQPLDGGEAKLIGGGSSTGGGSSGSSSSSSGVIVSGSGNSFGGSNALHDAAPNVVVVPAGELQRLRAQAQQLKLQLMRKHDEEARLEAYESFVAQQARSAYARLRDLLRASSDFALCFDIELHARKGVQTVSG